MATCVACKGSGYTDYAAMPCEVCWGVGRMTKKKPWPLGALKDPVIWVLEREDLRRVLSSLQANQVALRAAQAPGPIGLLLEDVYKEAAGAYDSLISQVEDLLEKEPEL